MASAGALIASPQLSAAQSSRFVPGESTAWRFDYSNRTTSDLRSLFGFDSVSTPGAPRSQLSHDIESEVHGELVQTVLDRRGVNFHVAYHLRNGSVRLRINGEEAPSDARRIEKSLLSPVFAVLDPDGRVVGVRLHSKHDALSQSFIRTLVASSQFVLPSKSMLPGTWTSREEDPAGSYDARYRPGTSPGSMRTYVRTKLRYHSQAPPKRKGEPALTQIVEPSGNVTGVIDAQRRLVALDGTETQRVLVGDKVIARGKTVVAIKHTSREREGAERLASLRESARASERMVASTPLFAPELEEKSDAATHRGELRGETAETLLAELARFEARATDTGSTTPLYLRLKALVYLQPASSRLLGDVLRTARANGPTLLVLSGALGAVGHSEAQSALAGVIAARTGDWPALATLIPVLGGVSRPDERSVKEILKLAFGSPNREIASTARLAAGTMARSIAVESPSRARPIVGRLIAALDTSASASSKRELLLALGNTGSSLALPSISRFARDSDASLRIAAMLALRWIDGDKAETLLLKALSNDPDTAVRAAADRAMGDRRGRTINGPPLRAR